MKSPAQWLVVPVVWLASLYVASAQTGNGVAVAISAGRVRGIPARPVPLPLGLAHAGQLAAVQFDLRFDPARLIGGELAGRSATNAVLRWRQIAPGEYRVLLHGNGTTSVPSQVAMGDLLVTVPAGLELGGGGAVVITNVVASSLRATALAPIHREDGSVEVRPIDLGPDGSVDFLLSTASDESYIVQATTDLVGWVNISTNSALQGYVVARDAEATNFPARFYRAVLLQATGGEAGSNGMLRGGNGMGLGNTALSGRRYVLQSSTSLTEWENVATNVDPDVLLNLTNRLRTGLPDRFFRIQDAE